MAPVSNLEGRWWCIKFSTLVISFVPLLSVVYVVLFDSGELLCEDMVNNLSVGLNERGEFVVSINKLGHPQKICRVERQDINVKHGTVVHFIDRVLFPPAF